MNCTFIIFVYILFHNKMQLRSYEKDYFIILHMFFFYICYVCLFIRVYSWIFMVCLIGHGQINIMISFSL